MTEKYINDFNEKATGWDNNPMHWDRSEAIAKEIIKLIPLNKEMTALEFGAGTGILSFLLKDHLKEIMLLDNSSEMIKVINGKIESTKVKNLKALNFDLEHSDFKTGKFDLIFSQMVLHHVTDIDNIIKKFYNLLSPGGYLAIADLYTEDGSFHGEGFTGHMGFDIEKLSNKISKAGFSNISERQCFVINRKISDNETKQFGVFLLIAKRIR
ncbi:MAG TPA: class I SAM-dependent methyltransferase [Bacteroidales bacterium]